MLLCLLLLAAAFSAPVVAQSCQMCYSGNGFASYKDKASPCCYMCPPGFSCNGTVATACEMSVSFQPNWGMNHCRPTRICNSSFETIAPTTTSDRVCQPYARCNATTHFERIPPTNTTDRTCTQLRVCDAPREYELTAPTATTDRVCRSTRVCNTLTELVAVAATATSDAQCVCRPDFVGTPCTKCENVAPGCHTCMPGDNGSIMCTECLLAFQPVQTAHGLRCVRCETENCAQCDQNAACTDCRPGFRLTSAGGCACNMSGCATCGGNGTCLACLSGHHRVSSDACEPVTTTVATAVAFTETSSTMSSSPSTSSTTSEWIAETSRTPTSTTPSPASTINVTEDRTTAATASSSFSSATAVAIVGAVIGSVAMIVVVGVVAANSRRKRAASRAEERVYETPDRAVIANSTYSAPATLPRPRRMTQVVPEYEEPAALTALALPAQPAEPYYDLGTVGDGYLTIEDVVNA